MDVDLLQEEVKQIKNEVAGLLERIDSLGNSLAKALRQHALYRLDTDGKIEAIDAEVAKVESQSHANFTTVHESLRGLGQEQMELRKDFETLKNSCSCVPPTETPPTCIPTTPTSPTPTTLTTSTTPTDTPTTSTTPTTPTEPSRTCPSEECYKCCDTRGSRVFEADLTSGEYFIAPGSGVAWTVTPGTNGNNCNLQGVLKITYPTANPQRRLLRFELYFSRSNSGFNFNIGDSTNNGYGGDAGQTSNAAEVHNVNKRWYVYSNILPGYLQYASSNLLVDSLPDVISEHVTVTIGDEHIEFDNHNGTQRCYDSRFLFTLGGQAATYGPVNYDIFFGLNRVITSSFRSGTGLCRAVITALDCNE